MAYYTFLKSLRSLEEFRKKPHVKIPPESPSTNFQSLAKFKNPIFNSEIPFSLFSARPTLPPTRPLAQPTRWPHCPRRLKPPLPAHLAHGRSRLHGKYVFPFGSRIPSWPPFPRLSINRALAVSSITHLQPPELACAATAPRPPSATHLHASGATEPLPPCLHFPSLTSPLKPSPIFNGVKAINAGVNPPATPPRRSPDAYKRRAPTVEFTARLPASLRFSPRSSLPLTKRHRLRFCTTVRSPCAPLSVALPPVSFGAPEQPQAELR
jgi:hypothetical protein